MDCDQKFGITITSIICGTIALLVGCCTASGYAKRDALLKCEASAIECKCLIYGNDYCYLAYNIPADVILAIEINNN